MAKQKIEYIPFIEGNQPYYCNSKPTKGNGYKTTFTLREICFSPRVFSASVKHWYGNDVKVIFKENYSFDDELIVSDVYSSNAGITIELMSKRTRKTYCATGDEAYKIIMMAKYGAVRGSFTFKPIDRYKYSLVILDPTTEYYIKDDITNRIISSNYSEDVIKTIFDSFPKDMKETSHIDARWK